MLSSRCNDPFPRAGGPPLSQARREIKAELEAYKLLDKSLFEVWINEVAPRLVAIGIVGRHASKLYAIAIS